MMVSAPAPTALCNRLMILLLFLMGAGLVALLVDRQEKQREIDALRGAGVTSSRPTSEPSKGESETDGSMPLSSEPTPGSRGPIVGAWSKPVRGVRGRLVTSLDDLDRGSRFVSIYLELENVSDAATPIEIGAEREVRFDLYKEDGSLVPRLGVTYNAIEHGPLPILLPMASRFRYRVSRTGCGGPGNEDLLICFVRARWIIKAKDTTPYFVAGTMTVPGDDWLRRRSPWHGDLTLPPARVDTDPN